MEEEERQDREFDCPLCGGKGSVETVDEEGAARKVVCPVCEGRGKVSAKRARFVLGKASKRYSVRRFFRRFGRGGGGGGRFRRPSAYRLPLSMDSRAGSQDRLVPEESSDITGTGAERVPNQAEEGYETVEAELDAIVPEESLEVEELWQGELDLRLAEALPEQQVRREFSAADAQLEVEQPEVPDLVSDETTEATLEIAHDSLVGDLDYRIEPYPTELFEDVDYDALDDELGPGEILPPGGLGGMV